MSQNIAKQTEVENGLLKLLIEGLRSTLSWKVHSSDFSRKLSTVRFIVRSFQGHLDRLFALEEYDGYMDLVNKRSPRLSRTVPGLLCWRVSCMGQSFCSVPCFRPSSDRHVSNVSAVRTKHTPH